MNFEIDGATRELPGKQSGKKGDVRYIFTFLQGFKLEYFK